MTENVTYRVAVCDDETVFRKQLMKILREYDGNLCIREYENGEQLLQSGEAFELVFLDIEMPGSDGMVTATKLRERNAKIQIVFLTSHVEYVFEAFKVRAFRFLKKPVTSEEVSEALAQFFVEQREEEKIVLFQKGKTVEIPITQVVYLEAFGDGTYIYDKNGQVYSSTLQLREWEEKLGGKGFFRIHKSYMVSLLYVKRRENEQIELKELDVTLKISRRNVGKFAEAYLEYIDKNAKTVWGGKTDAV
ncbi:MAG: response regulator transcription factor [Lachnospiraceae bacterium]|nr:response regulator transcription factor [Lachnospiraceae bacterium]